MGFPVFFHNYSLFAFSVTVANAVYIKVYGIPVECYKEGKKHVSIRAGEEKPKEEKDTKHSV